MFGWLFQSRPTRPGPTARRARLLLESLETRECLSTSLSLQATTLTGHRARLSGVVQSADPTHTSITFSGAAAGTVTPKADGSYTWTTSTAKLGSVTATAADVQGAAFDTAVANITDAAPTLTLALVHTGRKLTLSGKVTDLDAAGRLITFSGVVSGTTTTNGTGSYSYTAEPSGPGSIQAVTSDLWGQSSDAAAVSFTNLAPVITAFRASEGALNFWTFSGTVADESPAGLTVRLGGLASLAGITASVQADGSFSVSVQLRPGEKGMATAQTTDWWGLDSNVATCFVDPG